MSWARRGLGYKIHKAARLRPPGPFVVLGGWGPWGAAGGSANMIMAMGGRGSPRRALPETRKICRSWRTARLRATMTMGVDHIILVKLKLISGAHPKQATCPA